MKYLNTFLITITLSCAFLSAEVPKAIEVLQSVSTAFKDVSKKIKPSVVSIEITYKKNFSQQQMHPFFRQMPQQEIPAPKGSGSGVIYNKEGYIITNSHVVKDSQEIQVKLYDGRKIKATKIGEDPQTDIAVLKVEDPNIQTALYGDSDNVEVGEWAIAIGNPLGFDHTVTVGIISAKGRSDLRSPNDKAYEDFIQTDAAINQGNSGGPLCNIKGEVIGINSMIASSSGGSQGLGFAIPINMVKNIVDQLINGGVVKRGYLGVIISDVDEKLARQFGYKEIYGAIIDSVAPGTPAEKGGVQIGDIFMKMNGKKIKNHKDLRNLVSQQDPGSEVIFTIFRMGKKMELKIILGDLEGQFGKAKETLGLKVRPASAEELHNFSVSKGVIIESVQPGSPAYRARLRAGMLIASVDQKKVDSPASFYNESNRSLTGDDNEILLYVKTQNSGFFIVLER